MPFSDIHGFKGDREIYDASVGAAGAGFVLLYAARTGCIRTPCSGPPMWANGCSKSRSEPRPA